MPANDNKVTIYPDGKEETIRPDGTKIIKYPDGETMTIYANGDKAITHLDRSISVDILNMNSWSRHYPDGREERTPRPEKDKIK